MRRILALAAAAAACFALGACIFFAGSTSGYTTESEAGTGQGCSSAAECGEDAGLVCCAASALGPGECQPSPCGIQLCTVAKECSAGTCIDQVCQGQEVHACGHLPGCTKRGSDSGASGEDASSEDAGSDDASAANDGASAE